MIDQGRVFAVGQGGRMVAVELITGQRAWEINIAGISTPWVAGDWVFVVTDRAQLLAIARASGRIRWISQLRRYRDEDDRKGPIFWRGPVLAGNRLILTSSIGQIAYVSPADGSIIGEQDDAGADLVHADRRQQHAVHARRQRPADRLALIARRRPPRLTLPS